MRWVVQWLLPQGAIAYTVPFNRYFLGLTA